MHVGVKGLARTRSCAQAVEIGYVQLTAHAIEQSTTTNRPSPRGGPHSTKSQIASRWHPHPRQTTWLLCQNYRRTCSPMKLRHSTDPTTSKTECPSVPATFCSPRIIARIWKMMFMRKISECMPPSCLHHAARKHFVRVDSNTPAHVNLFLRTCNTCNAPV